MPQEITKRMAYYAKNYYDNYKNMQNDAQFNGYNYADLYHKVYYDYNTCAKLYENMETPPTAEGNPDSFDLYERSVGKLIAQTLFAMTVPDDVKEKLPTNADYSFQVNPADLFHNLKIETADLKANFANIDLTLTGKDPEPEKDDDGGLTDEEREDILYGDDEEDEPEFDTDEYDDFLEDNFKDDLKKGHIKDPVTVGVSEDSPLGMAFGQMFEGKTYSEKEKNIQIGEEGYVDFYRFTHDEGDSPKRTATKNGLNALASVLGGRNINKSLTDDVLDQMEKAAREAEEAKARTSFVDDEAEIAYAKKEQNRQMTVKGGYLALRGQWENRTVGDIFSHPFRSIREYASYKKAEKEVLKCEGETKEGLDKLAGEAGRIYDFGKRVPTVNQAYIKDLEAVEQELAKTRHAVSFEKSEQELLGEQLGDVFGHKPAALHEQNKKIDQPSLTQNKEMGMGK